MARFPNASWAVTVKSNGVPAKAVPGALVLKISYGHEPLTDLEGTNVVLNGHNSATIVVNRQKIYDVPVVS